MIWVISFPKRRILFGKLLSNLEISYQFVRTVGIVSFTYRENVNAAGSLVHNKEYNYLEPCPVEGTII